MRTLPPTVAFLAALVCLPSPVSATVMVEVPLEDMAVDADAIAIGTVTRSGVQMVFERGRMLPWTATTLNVEEWIKGGDGAPTLVIHERGGEWQGGGMRIDGTPEYQVGEHVVVFLFRDPVGRLRTYGMVQGKFVIRAAVDGPTLVERDLTGVGFARWNSGGMSVQPPPPPATMTLDELLARTRFALEAVR